MISSKQQFVFVGIPKTGTTSIQYFFDPLSVPPSTNHETFMGWNDQHKIFMQHATMSQILRIYPLDISSYFKFCFVRNPFDRAVSDWKWLCKDQQISGSFTDYLLSKNTFSKVLTGERNKDWRGDHIIPQYEFIHDEQGNLLVDFIGKFESLQKDFQHVCNALNIPYSFLPNVTGANGKLTTNNEPAMVKSVNYIKYYDEESLSLVKSIYAKDFETFGYNMELEL